MNERKKISHTTIGEIALADAFLEFAKMVDTGHVFSEEHRKNGLFSYILTNKQRDKVTKICEHNGWDKNESKGITITISTLAHVLNARKGKDSLTVDECAQILISTYSKNSEITLNKGRDKQAIILNAQKRFYVGRNSFYGLAILSVSKNNLAQITAYHANWAKIQAMLR